MIGDEAMAKNDYEKELIRRLDILIALELDRPRPDKAPSMTKKVERLLGFGLKPAEVGRVLGKTTKYVTAITAMKKKAVKKPEHQ